MQIMCPQGKGGKSKKAPNKFDEEEEEMEDDE